MNENKCNAMRLSLELKLPEGCSYDELTAMVVRALAAMPGDMPAVPTPGASMIVKDPKTAASIGLIHLVPR
jgi:hypothetical protein